MQPSEETMSAPSPNPAAEERLARLAALDEDARRILRVLSVIYEPVGHNQLKRVVDHLRWRDRGGAPLGTRVDKELRERLLENGLMVQTRGGTLLCHPNIVEILTRECVADGSFASIVAAAEEMLPTASRTAWVPSPERQARILRVALYTGEEARVLELLQQAAEGSATDVPYRQVQSLDAICLHPPDPAMLATLSPRLQVLALAPTLRIASQVLVPRQESYEVMEALLPPLAATRADAAEALAEQRLLRGRPADAAALLAGRDEPHALALAGALALMQGDFEAAIGHFEASQRRARKLTRKRNIYTPGLPGVLYLCALLRRGRRADLEQIERQVNISDRAGFSEPLHFSFKVLADVRNVFALEADPEDGYWARVHEPPGAYDALFQQLGMHWVDLPANPALMQALAEYAQEAVAAGIDWYAREAAALLAARGCEVPAAVRDVPVPAGTAPLAELLAPQSAWERAIDALKGLRAEQQPDAGAAAPADTADQRLAWLLDPDPDAPDLQPREQRRSKRGTWTKGRPVALVRLAETPDEIPYLTPQDRAICACIIVERQTYWYRGAEHKDYRLDLDRALPAAVGHPALLRAGSNEPLALTLAAPTLTVVRRADDILVHLDPEPPEEGTVLPVEESAGRVRLVRFDAGHLRIGRILGRDGLAVPAGGQQRLLEGLAAVAPLIPVQSDIGAGADGEAAERVPADPRPHVLLTPVDDGLRVELRVRPFGDAGGTGRPPELHPGEGRATLLAELDGRALACTRDLPAERAAARAVLEQVPALDAETGWAWTLNDPELALSALEQLHALGDAVVLEWPQGRRIALSPEARPGQVQVTVGRGRQGDWLEVSGGLRLDDGRVLAMRELLRLAAESPGRYARLGEDDYLVLSDALRRRLDGLRGLTDQGRFHPLAAPAVAELVDGMELAAGPAWRELLQRLAAAEALEPEVPSTLQAELRDYQAEGYRWLARLAHWGAGACLADDMGLGKTVQALALILARAADGPTLVLAPTSVCGNWLDEATRFAPTLKPLRFGAGDRAAMLAAAGPFDLVVASYGLLQTEGERLAEVHWCTVVADEAQAFKNAVTQRSRAIMKLRADFRVITTGTPIENRLGELWNLFRFINPGLLGSHKDFNQRFANPIEQDRDAAARARLRRLLRPFILRRLKSEVLSELPPRTEITLDIELGADERALYEAIRREALERIEMAAGSDPGQSRMQVLAEIMRLRRACCHPRLALPDSDLPSAKLAAFAELTDELIDNRHKALVFSQFVGHLTLLREHLERRGIAYQYLDGSTPEPQRRAAVAAFQAGAGEMFLISLRAGGAGLNLTAADYVIHMDPWWNPAVEDQASDRAHRIGQERPVTIYRLVARDTIEERILKLHAKKRDLADGLLAETGDGGRLSLEEMIALVRGAADGR
jgi:superfamily II DNA or RNA helicase